MPAKSKAQQRFMGMVHAVQKGDMKAPSKEVEKAADSMSDADAKDYASTKHKGLPNHVKKENMEKELKEIIRQTYRESLRESINEDATELPQATIPSAVKVKLQMAIDKIKDSKLSNNAKLQLVAQVIDALDVDKSQLSNIANKIRSKMESVQMNEISSIDGLNDVVKGQTSQIEGMKLSKGMAEHIISWMNTSPYGKKYNPWVKKNSIAKILPIAFNWGLHRGLPSNLKNEFVALKAKYGKEETKESVVKEAKYPTNLYVGSVIYGQGFTGLKGIEGGKYYKVVEMDDTTATLAPCDQKGKITGSKKVRHKLDSIEGGIKTAKRGDENGIVIESVVNESISHEAMGIASMTNTRKEAVQKFIDDNNLDAKEILTHVTKGKLPERIRFVQALVGTPNNSSFKWYVKNYANESVVNEAKVIDIIDRFEHLKLPDIVYLNKKPYTGKTFVMNGYNGYTSSDTDGWVYDSNTRKPLTDKQGNILRATTHRGAKWDFKNGIRESVNEGKKAFKINPPIGSSKYSISAYDGVSKHKDGSPFWDILIFKNKADLERRAKYFRGEKYIEEGIVTEGRYDADLDKIEAVVKNATSFMNVGSELKKAGIKYDFTTSMIPMYMIKVSGNTIAICNKKYAAGAEREVKDIAIGLLN